MQAVDIRQIADKFPDKRSGLKELYDKGPQSSFFLVKFWVNIFLCAFSLQDFLGNLQILCNLNFCLPACLPGSGILEGEAEQLTFIFFWQ